MGRRPDDEAATVRVGGERPRRADSSSDRDDTEPIAAPDALEAHVLPPRFEPIAVIGTGGMGRVLRVLDRSLHREVAVKLIKLQQLADEPTRLRFLREARAAGTLRHPNIVTVHDVAPDGTYLVMELVEGESLSARLRRDKRLPVAEVRRIGAALLGALTAAHAAGIIHRDVKPANILLDTIGAVKLTDFGVASFGDSELTSTGQMVGTPAYMAPEQLRARRVDERADIYAAGATLFEAATGIRLNNEKEQVGDPERAVLDATGDRALAQAIARAVREKEAERFATAAELAIALERGTPTGRGRRRLVTGVLALGAIGGIAAVVATRDHGHGASAVSAAERPLAIAMLPFENRVGDSRLDFAATGLPHMLGEQLGHLDRLRVLGYYRVRDRLADPSAPAAAWLDAARALGATLAIRGEITQVDARVRVSVIVERTDGVVVRELARDTVIDRVPETVQALAPEIAGAALGAPSAIPAAASHGFEIERDLQLGVAAFERQDFDEAAAHLTAAVARDDSVAEAHYYLAILDWWRLGTAGEHIRRALAGNLGPSDRDFLVGLQLLVDLDYPRAVDYFRDLARRVPEHRDIHYGLFEALFHGGYPREAIAAYAQLHELAPRFMVGGEHAMLYYLTRGDTDGIAWMQHNWQPPADERAVWAARVLFAQRRPSDAVRSLEQAAEEDPAGGVKLGRALVEAYAATAQVPLASEANARLAADPGYQAIAGYGLAIASGDASDALRTRAWRTLALGVPGQKPWVPWLEVVALELPAGDRTRLRADLQDHPLAGHVMDEDAGIALIAGAIGDDAILTAARASHFPQVAAIADAYTAEARGDAKLAASAWRRAIDLNSEGPMLPLLWLATARQLVAAHDPAGVLAACGEVIAPRVFTWAWASTVGPCLRWSAEADAALHRTEAARAAWQQLLALRTRAPADDELVKAARAALH